MTPPTANPDARNAAMQLAPEMPDAALQVIMHSERSIRPQDAVDLFREEGWWPHRTTAITAAMLENSLAVGAWRGTRLVGFARAVTDSVERAYVEDVVVAHTDRRAGIGVQLVEALMTGLAHIPTVSLFCSAEHVDFYKLNGFHRTRQVVMHREIEASDEAVAPAQAVVGEPRGA
jgi:ribosomal protein S18 acetylase RimI-like enzyme